MRDKDFNNQFIRIKGAKVNNLKNIDVSIPRNKLVVITGLSGSGKSSLAFDTLYAEGQRRYVESLSAYARQFMGRMAKPEVDLIEGIPPAIAIEQKSITKNPRSTVGTSTEIYEYIKLLYSRVGKTYSPISGEVVKRNSVTEVTDFAYQLTEDTRIFIFAPLIIKLERSLEEQFSILLQQGYSRILYEDLIEPISEAIKNPENYTSSKLYVLVDRLKIEHNLELRNRLSDSIQSAFFEGNGSCFIKVQTNDSDENFEFSNRFELDGILFEEPSINMFSFNNPFGACQRCEGYGQIIGIDDDLVIPNRSLSVFEDAIACWKFESTKEWKQLLIGNAHKFDFPIHRAIEDLTEQEVQLLWDGNKYFKGINAFFSYLEEHNYKIQNRVFISRFRGKTICPECKGTRLRKDAQYVKIAGKSITDIVLMPVENSLEFFKNINFDSESETTISARIIIEIKNRLQFLSDVGLGYLTLNRLTNSLSGGESQRINLATSLGSSLVGSLYILDEPSIGLHSRDTERLIGVLKRLRDIGNTVVVVEHDEDIIKSADYIIDIGPNSGRLGGEVVFAGTPLELKDSDSYTAQYMTGRMHIPVPKIRRNWHNSIIVEGAKENNLKNINVTIPLEIFTVITGVSGSGKTTLIKKILYTALKRQLGEGMTDKPGKHSGISGDLMRISAIELIDQNPIGRSSRSNPATYTKTFDDIRQLFADQPLSKNRGYKAGFFSYNVPGGRCDECEGEGKVYIEMQFMADVEIICEECHGKRYKDEALEVKFQDKNISDILNMTVNQAIEFFEVHIKLGTVIKRVVEKLRPLQDVGLGYLMLGQSSSTLSGGEAQRLKLASFLVKGSNTSPTLFIFDEPTTGLHVHDIQKLYTSFDLLIEKGHTVLVIEHNPEIIKCADWIIDLGPDGGDKGGLVVFTGTPEQLGSSSTSITAKYIQNKL
ncbi:MAG: excinuclease ABC subunit UvrA [Bacteroidota bacterium]